MEVSKIMVEIAESIRSMGPKEAEDRLNFFKDEGAISTVEYAQLWHMVHGGSVTITSSEPSKSDGLGRGEKIAMWCFIIGVPTFLCAWFSSMF